MSAVEKPGVKIRLASSASLGLRVGGRSGPCATPLLADARQVQPGAVVAELDADLVAFLGAATRRSAGRRPCRRPCARSGRSMPCATQLRSRCSNGPVMRSSTPRSISIEPPTMSSRTCLPVSLAAWRTTRYRRSDSPSNSTMRVRSRSSCSSRVSRAWAASSSSVDLQRALQAALHGGHVVDRLGHHAGEFLEAREAVELQRVEGLRGGLGGLHARADLRLGLQLDVAQLAAQPLQVVGQVAQRALDLADVGLDARTRDAHLAGLVDQAVEQRRAHPHRGRLAAAARSAAGSAGAGRGVGETRPVDAAPAGSGTATAVGSSFGAARLGRGAARRGSRQRRRGARPAGSQRSAAVDGAHRRHQSAAPARPAAAPARGIAPALQGLERRLDQRVDAAEQRLDVGRPRIVAREQVLDRGFEPVRHLAQAHRAGQAGTALERVQGAHAGRRRGRLGRAGAPSRACATASCGSSSCASSSKIGNSSASTASTASMSSSMSMCVVARDGAVAAGAGGSGRQSASAEAGDTIGSATSAPALGRAARRPARSGATSTSASAARHRSGSCRSAAPPLASPPGRRRVSATAVGAAVAASRRRASSVSMFGQARRAVRAHGAFRKPAANWCSRRRISSAASMNSCGLAGVPCRRRCERISACSSARASCDRSVKPTVRRTAGQRMRQRHGGLADRPVQLHAPIRPVRCPGGATARRPRSGRC